MLRPPNIPPIPEKKPIEPTKLDDFFFSPQEQIIKTTPVGGGGGIIPPLWLLQVDDENVKVTLGTVNDITPTGANANIDVSGSDGTWAIYLHADLNASGVPTAVEILSSSSGTVPADTFEDAYKLIGEVEVASSVITEVNATLGWSQTFVTCGRDPEDPETTPGTYYWVVA
jgi:hypothetical protein